MSTIRVFFNWRLETSDKCDRKAGFSDRDLTNHMPWRRSIHNYEQNQLKHMTLTSNPHDIQWLLLYSIIYLTEYITKILVVNTYSFDS